MRQVDFMVPLYVEVMGCRYPIASLWEGKVREEDNTWREYIHGVSLEFENGWRMNIYVSDMLPQGSRGVAITDDGVDLVMVDATPGDHAEDEDGDPILVNWEDVDKIWGFISAEEESSIPRHRSMAHISRPWQLELLIREIIPSWPMGTLPAGITNAFPKD